MRIMNSMVAIGNTVVYISKLQRVDPKSSHYKKKQL